MSTEILKIAEMKPQILSITLNRPERKNALSIELAEQLSRALVLAAQNETLKIIVIRGSEHCFSAGGDLKNFEQNLSQSEELFFEVSTHLNACILQIQKMSQTVVAAIEGPAYAAGFGLALSCDLLLMSKSARLSPSFSNIALSPNAGTTFFLTRLLGPKLALEAFQKARVFNSEEALQCGLVNQVFPDESFDDCLDQYLDELLLRPQAACARMKNLLNGVFDRSLSDQIDLERQHISLSSTHSDFKEGVTAFVNKKKPEFNQ